MSEPLERPGMRKLTWQEIKMILAERTLPVLQEPIPDHPWRHDDYLPLNLWDQTKDE